MVEGKEEEEGFEDCLSMLMNDVIRQRLIEQLVKICTFFGFEGYLLNFEIDLVRDVDDLLPFMSTEPVLSRSRIEQTYHISCQIFSLLLTM